MPWPVQNIFLFRKSHHLNVKRGTKYNLQWQPKIITKTVLVNNLPINTRFALRPKTLFQVFSTSFLIKTLLQDGLVEFEL